MKTTLACMALIGMAPVAAAVYQCDDGRGGKLFSDRPCGNDATEVTLQYRPSASVPARPVPAAPDPMQAERRRLEQERRAIEQEKARLAARQAQAAPGMVGLSESEQRRLARKKQIKRGMTEEWLRRSWGDPDRSFRHFNDDGSVTQEYIYEESGIGHPDRRVYLRNGVVVDLFDPTKKVR